MRRRVTHDLDGISVALTEARRKPERHYSGRVGWLRAAVLGANDGLVSTSSLIIGVALADASRNAILLAGTAGVVAGAVSMAAGEYVSVKSQADTERADLRRERYELSIDPSGELEELATTFERRGVEHALAQEVARQLMEADALGAHAREELGHSVSGGARPLQAALASALTFGSAALLPLAVVAATPANVRVPSIGVVTVLSLALLGVLGARTGGAPPFPAALRVCFWGTLAMTVTGAAGLLFGAIA